LQGVFRSSGSLPLPEPSRSMSSSVFGMQSRRLSPQIWHHEGREQFDLSLTLPCLPPQVAISTRGRVILHFNTEDSSIFSRHRLEPLKLVQNQGNGFPSFLDFPPLTVHSLSRPPWKAGHRKSRKPTFTPPFLVRESPFFFRYLPPLTFFTGQ